MSDWDRSLSLITSLPREEGLVPLTPDEMPSGFQTYRISAMIVEKGHRLCALGEYTRAHNPCTRSALLSNAQAGIRLMKHTPARPGLVLAMRFYAGNRPIRGVCKNRFRSPCHLVFVYFSRSEEAQAPFQRMNEILLLYHRVSGLDITSIWRHSD